MCWVLAKQAEGPASRDAFGCHSGGGDRPLWHSLGYLWPVIFQAAPFRNVRLLVLGRLTVFVLDVYVFVGKIP